MSFEHACTELRLYAENTGEFYPEVRRLIGVMARGDRLSVSVEQSVEEFLSGWVNLVYQAAVWYNRDFPGEKHYSGVIKAVAREWAIYSLTRVREGEKGLYD